MRESFIFPYTFWSPLKNMRGREAITSTPQFSPKSAGIDSSSPKHNKKQEQIVEKQEFNKIQNICKEVATVASQLWSSQLMLA